MRVSELLLRDVRPYGDVAVDVRITDGRIGGADRRGEDDAGDRCKHARNDEGEDAYPDDVDARGVGGADVAADREQIAPIRGSAEQPPGDRYIEPFAVIAHAVEGSWSDGVVAEETTSPRKW